MLKVQDRALEAIVCLPTIMPITVISKAQVTFILNPPFATPSIIITHHMIVNVTVLMSLRILGPLPVPCMNLNAHERICVGQIQLRKLYIQVDQLGQTIAMILMIRTRNICATVLTQIRHAGF